MQPEISVVVPIYGVERYLNQCVDSILNQTFKNIEVILVDDGSKDRCPQIVDEYAAKDSRVVAIHQPNGGYGKAVNAGIRRAQGKYVGIIESDDWIASDMYEKLYAQAEKTGAEITKGNFYWVTNSTKGEMSVFLPWTKLAARGEIFTLQEKPKLFMDHSSLWSALYRRDFFEKHQIKFQETAEACYQDWPFCADVYSVAKSITMLPEPLVFYRNDVDNTNSSSQVKSRKLIKIIHQALCARDILIKNKAFGSGVAEAWSKQAYVASRSFFEKIADEYKEEMFGEMSKLYQIILSDKPVFEHFNTEEVRYLITAAGCQSFDEHKLRFPEFYKVTKVEKMKLFGFIPFLSIRSKKNKVWVKLFNVLPLLTIKR